ncbi:MAG: hypothetical protein GY759_05580 [Chloroflexi bacterium]|nr:hypothetical protein [Chloroflexota bacterium]
MPSTFLPKGVATYAAPYRLIAGDLALADIMISDIDEHGLWDETKRQAMKFSEGIWVNAPFDILG